MARALRTFENSLKRFGDSTLVIGQQRNFREYKARREPDIHSRSKVCNALAQPKGYHLSSCVVIEIITAPEVELKLTLSFCERCGTTCFKTADNMEDVVTVLAGTLGGEGFEQATPGAELRNKHTAGGCLN